MASGIRNPALDALAKCIAPELVVAEVLVRKIPEGFDLRNVSDRDVASVKLVSADGLRDIAQFTKERQFRPLKSAPNLRGGWRFLAHDASELDFALQCLYPGAVADWFAARQANPPATDYRDFTARQTGMYRITTMLRDEQVAQVANAGCHPRFCLKRRLWNLSGIGADQAAEKSLIPCLEPCAVLLEFARTVARIEQNEKNGVPLASDELVTITRALEQMARSPSSNTHEADFAASDNRRRARWLWEKLRTAMSRKEKHEDK